MSDPGGGGGGGGGVGSSGGGVGGGGSVAAAAALSPHHHHHSNAQMRQVLAAYVRNAHTLTGPSRLEQEHLQVSTAKFKLANDVVLRKVYPGETGPGLSASYRKDTAAFTNGQVYDLNKQMMLQRERFLRQMQEQQIHSEKERLREIQQAAAAAAAAAASASRMRQNSGPEQAPLPPRSSHLSGEKIRLLRETQKEAERQRLEAERKAKEDGKEASGKAAGNSQLLMATTPAAAFKSPSAPGSSSTAVPIMSSSDKTWSELEETRLDGERISCFNVGGELRLCLPQILNSVLERLSLKDINQACEELQIYCATCTPDQLQVLKDAKVLPETAYQCGLITKSDAERLCAYLLDRSPPRASLRLGDPKTSPFSFRVEHDCFGHCEGLVLPEAYTAPNARCIECVQCEGLFSPQKFVCHSHENTENRTCHWGFNSENWRHYLRLSETYGEEERSRHTKVVEDFKMRYLPSGLKRRQEEDMRDELKQHSKRPKQMEDLPPLGPTDPYALMSYLGMPAANFRPWSPSKSGPGGYQSFPPCFSGPVPFPPRSGPHHGLEVVRCREDPERGGVSPPLALEVYRRTADSPPLLTAPPLKRKLVQEKVSDNARFPTLADEISTIKEALDGAPVQAKEAVLKILERLTQRVDRAERDRDLAVSRCRELQARYDQLEEELAKKRGELRELLRQETGSSRPRDHDLSLKREMELEAGSSVGCGADTAGHPHSLPEDREMDRLSERSGGSVSRLETFSLASGLPKIELKSPARVLEETTGGGVGGGGGRSASRAETDRLKIGSTPVSEDLKARMMKMEAELSRMRQELSLRSQPPLHCQGLGSSGANSTSPTPSPTSASEDSPSHQGD